MPLCTNPPRPDCRTTVPDPAGKPRTNAQRPDHRNRRSGLWALPSRQLPLGSWGTSRRRRRQTFGSYVGTMSGDLRSARPRAT